MIRSAMGAVVVVLAASACSDRMRVDVVVSSRGVRVSVMEAEPPHACDELPFVPLGECGDTTDVSVCGKPLPGHGVAGVRVVRAGQVVASADWPEGNLSAWADAEVAGLADVEVVVVARNGPEVTIPVPAVSPPRPTITRATQSGHDYDVRWTTEPAASSAIVEVVGSLGSRRCHVPDVGQHALVHRWGAHSAKVTTFAASTTHARPFLEAHVWVGDTAEVPVSP